MPAAQEAIYYAYGDSPTVLAQSPHVEGLQKRGYEVLRPDSLARLTEVSRPVGRRDHARDAHHRQHEG